MKDSELLINVHGRLISVKDALAAGLIKLNDDGSHTVITSDAESFVSPEGVAADGTKWSQS